MTVIIPDLISSDQQFRKQVRDALTALAAGTSFPDNSIALSKLVQIADQTVLGNFSGGTANIVAVPDPGGP